MSNPLILLFQNNEAPAPAGGQNMIFWMLGIMAIFYFLLFLPQRKENKRRQAMLAQLKKHDWVVTHSGMYGQVTDVAADEVTLKIDDNQNVRARFKRAAIAGIVDKEPAKVEEKAKAR